MPAQQTGVTRVAYPMVGQPYTFSAPQYSVQTCINFYPSQTHPADNAKYPSILLPTPGLDNVQTITDQDTATVRWMASINSIMYVVVGNGFYEVDPPTGSQTLLGTLSTTSGPVRHAYNNTQLLLVDGTAGYVYTVATDAFEIITDPDFVPPDTVTFQQGYAIYTIPGTNLFQVGTLNDFLDWDVLYQDQFQYTGDNLVTCISSHLDVWFFGETRTEVRQNQPDPNLPDAQPFRPIPGVLVEKGCAAAFSVCLLANNIFWLAQSEQGGYEVVTVTGEYVPTVVSTEALHQIWNTYDTVADAQAYSYIFNGHAFYVLTFPSANATWVYDAYQGIWHQWSTYTNTSTVGRHLSNCFCFHKATPYVGGHNTASIYELSGSTYTDDGQPIIRERTFPTVTNDLIRTNISQLWIDCEVGEGTATGQGVNPRVMLTTSGDGGKTWNPERLGNLGRKGEYSNKVRWYRFGTKRQFTARVRVSDPVYIALFGAKLELLSGTA